MTRAEKAKLLQATSTTSTVIAAPNVVAREKRKTFEIDGEKIAYEPERADSSEEIRQTNRDLLRQARGG